MQQAAPAASTAANRPSRSRPTKPIESQDLDIEDFPRSGRQRFDDAPPRPWWRPASTFGRILLATSSLAFLAGFIACALMLQRYLDRDSRFRIAGAANIQATGLSEVSRAEMLPVFGEDIGRNIFFVPLAERRRQLEKIPWVQSATVMRFLPDQLRVAIVERQPIAFVRHGQQIGLVDASGLLLNMPASMMAQHHYSFPVVTGIDARDPLAGRKARMAVYQRLLSELDSAGQHFSEQISEIDLTDPEDARVLMPEQGGDVLAHFGEDHFLERYQRYKAHIAEWRQQYPKLAAIDLRYEQQVVLEMAPGSGAAQAETVPGPSATKPADTTVTTAIKPSPSQPLAADATASAATLAVSDPHAQSTTKPPAKLATKPHDKKLTAALKARKKRAEQHRAALNASKPKPHPPTGQGQ
jgi:cell division protein FtsQ